MSKEFTYGIGECIDELHDTTHLLLCLQDAQASQDNKHPMALTQVIYEKVEGVQKELDKQLKIPDETEVPDGVKALQRLKRNIERIVKQRDKLYTENVKLKKELKKIASRKRK